MPQAPKLRKKRVKKSTYWFTAAGGDAVYFGNTDDVPYERARDEFRKYLQSLSEGRKHRNVLTCLELMERFLEWIENHRSHRTFDQRRRDCERFANFKIKGQKIADLAATKITGEDLEAWLDHCRKVDGLSEQTLLHRETSIKHCWNWGSKHPSPGSHLPPTFRPFAAVERVYVPHKVLTEDDLITQQEVDILFRAASIDLDTFHKFGPKKPRQLNPYEDFTDMLKAFYHTGARTGELGRVEVADVLFRTKQVVLGQHKTSKTQRVQHVRRITLNDETMEIFERHCAGKNKTDRVFTTSDGKPWQRRSLPSRFARVKEVAAKRKLGKVRDHITIYDFRHLWISDALMAGNEITTVARMAGTSIAMIEKVYGHFRNDHLQKAQARVDRLRRKAHV